MRHIQEGNGTGAETMGAIFVHVEGKISIPRCAQLGGQNFLGLPWPYYNDGRSGRCSFPFWNVVALRHDVPPGPAIQAEWTHLSDRSWREIAIGTTGLDCLDNWSQMFD